MEPKITTLLPTCFKIIAIHLVCRCSLQVWRRSFLKKGTPVTYFCPSLDTPRGGSGRKTTTLVRDHEYFIPTKFHQNPSSSSGEEVENVKSLRQTDGRRTDRRTDDGRCAMTIAHSSLWLRWAKNHKFVRFWYPIKSITAHKLSSPMHQLPVLNLKQYFVHDCTFLWQVAKLL